MEAQTWPNAEIIVLDNASDDGSAEIIREWAAQSRIPVRLMMETTRRGICANANLLVSQARGEFVAMMATDDYWFPRKTEQQVAALQKLGPDYAMAYSDAIRVNAQGAVLPQPNFIAEHRQFTNLPSGDVLDELIRGPFVPAMSGLIRRSAMLEMGPYDEELIYEDYDAWLRLATKWNFHAEVAPLCAYRVLDTSAIKTIAAQTQPAKLKSDAFIMAKVARIDRISTKVRLNTMRRVVRLSIELAGHCGPWGDALRHLHSQTGLSMLSLLACAHDICGPIGDVAAHRLLGLAIHHGILTATSIPFLPTEARARLDLMDDEHSLRSSTLAMPRVDDLDGWKEVFAAARALVENQSVDDWS